MAVLIESYCVVVRNSTIAARYPGGMDAYQRDCPNATLCADEHLCRIAFMVGEDADVFVAQLAAKGLTPYRGGAAEDVVIVRQFDRAALPPCDWIELADFRGHLIAWMAGAHHGDLHAPAGWSPDVPPMRHVTAEEAKEQLEFVRTENNVDVYRDRQTGQLFYTGRTASTSAEDRARHDELSQRAKELIDGLILLHNGPVEPLDDEGRRRLDEAIGLYEEVVRINPRNWAAMFFVGKVYQRLKDYPRGLEWFSRAHRVNPDQPDVAREAAIAAMDAGRPQEGIAFCRRALEVKPDDPGLQANLAVALLFSGKPEEAHGIATEALKRDPADE